MKPACAPGRSARRRGIANSRTRSRLRRPDPEEPGPNVASRPVEADAACKYARRDLGDHAADAVQREHSRSDLGDHATDALDHRKRSRSNLGKHPANTACRAASKPDGCPDPRDYSRWPKTPDRSSSDDRREPSASCFPHFSGRWRPVASPGAIVTAAPATSPASAVYSVATAANGGVQIFKNGSLIATAPPPSIAQITAQYGTQGAAPSGYTFSPTANGGIQIFDNGRLIGTTAPVQNGYQGPSGNIASSVANPIASGVGKTGVAATSNVVPCRPVHRCKL